MGSTTKMFTAVSVLRLAKKGVISLDQKIAPLVDDYLSDPQPCQQAIRWTPSSHICNQRLQRLAFRYRRPPLSRVYRQLLEGLEGLLG